MREARARALTLRYRESCVEINPLVGEIRPVGRVSSGVRLIDDARSPGPGNDIMKMLANVHERVEANEPSEAGRLRNLLLRTRNRRYMELTSGPIKFNDRWLGRPRGWLPLGYLDPPNAIIHVSMMILSREFVSSVSFGKKNYFDDCYW